MELTEEKRRSLTRKYSTNGLSDDCARIRQRKMAMFSLILLVIILLAVLSVR